MPERKTLSISNRIAELAIVGEFLEALGEEWDIPLPVVLSVNLALEEALTNVISYGYDDQDHHVIDMSFEKDGRKLTMVITDDGHAYDPTQREDPDITLAAEDRPIGGLGIFLIKKNMDSVTYQRSEERNHLILTKIL